MSETPQTPQDFLRELSVYKIADVAGSHSPDRSDSPGGVLLDSVRGDLIEAIDSGLNLFDEDAVREKAYAISETETFVYDHPRWLAFVDLCAYEEWDEISCMVGKETTMTDMAGIALDRIVERAVIGMVELLIDDLELADPNEDEEEGE